MSYPYLSRERLLFFPKFYLYNASEVVLFQTAVNESQLIQPAEHFIDARICRVALLQVHQDLLWRTLLRIRKFQLRQIF